MMSKVEGLAGVFIKSGNAAALANWYHAHLGIDFETHPSEPSYFVVFRTRDLSSGEVRENPVFAIEPSDEELAEPPARGYQLGLRVGDLEETLARLAENGVEVEGDRLEWEGGKHGWIRDLDGNRVELYEELPLAPDSPYR